MIDNVSFITTLHYNKGDCTEAHNYSHYGLTVFVVEVIHGPAYDISHRFQLLSRLLRLNGVDKKNTFLIKP